MADLRLESNETTFTLLAAGDTPEQTGPQAGGCILGLVGQRTDWKPGAPPLSFGVVLHRVTDDLRALRFLEANRLGMYYHLEITGPDGQVCRGLQPPESAGVNPLADPFAHARLMFLQLERIPVGKSLGERLEWDPAGDADRRHRLEPMIRTAIRGMGRYTVRAVYQLAEKDRQLRGDHPAAIRHVSNSVEVRIGE